MMLYFPLTTLITIVIIYFFFNKNIYWWDLFNIDMVVKTNTYFNNSLFNSILFYNELEAFHKQVPFLELLLLFNESILNSFNFFLIIQNFCEVQCFFLFLRKKDISSFYLFYMIFFLLFFVNDFFLFCA